MNGRSAARRRSAFRHDEIFATRLPPEFLQRGASHVTHLSASGAAFHCAAFIFHDSMTKNSHMVPQTGPALKPPSSVGGGGDLMRQQTVGRSDGHGWRRGLRNAWGQQRPVLMFAVTALGADG